MLRISTAKQFAAAHDQASLVDLQKARLEWLFNDRAAFAADMKSTRCRMRCHDVGNAVPDEMKRRTIVQRIASGQSALLDERVIRRLPARLAIEMRTATAGQKAQTRHRAKGVCGIGMSLLEPANGSCADATKNCAALPCASKEGVEATRAPDSQHVSGVAAADINDIALGNESRQIARLTKERQMAWATRQRREGGVDANNVAIGITAGGGKKTDRGIGIAGVLQNVTVETKVVRLHREASPTHRNDVFRLHDAECSSTWKSLRLRPRKFRLQRLV